MPIGQANDAPSSCGTPIWGNALCRHLPTSTVAQMMRRVCHITSVKYAKDTRQVPGFQVDAPMPRSFFQMHDVCLACLFALLLDTNGTWPCPLALCLTCLIAFLLSTNGVGHAPWHYALPLCTVPGHRLGWAIFAFALCLASLILHCSWTTSYCYCLTCASQYVPFRFLLCF